jgi:hypothetical protein
MKKAWFFECMQCGEKIPFGFGDDEVAKLKELGELRGEFSKGDPQTLLRDHMIERHGAKKEEGEMNGYLCYELVN